MVVRIGQRGARPRRTYFREWREYRNLTQEQLAERLETNKSAVSKMERGASRYNQSSLEAWAYALQCEPQDLISRPPDADDVSTLLHRASPEIKNAIEVLLRTGTKG